MKVVVVGCGLAGATSALALRDAGHDVVVVDRRPGPGQETSFANGGLLTPSMCDPWNAPGAGRVLLQSLFRPDSPLQLRPSALPALAGWGARFLWNARPSLYERHTREILQLALYSMRLFQGLCGRLGFTERGLPTGALKTFRDPTAFREAIIRSRSLEVFGLHARVLSPGETAAVEPKLAPIAPALAGALHFKSDEVGDAYSFVQAVVGATSAAGVPFHFGASIEGLEAKAGTVRRVLGREGALEADIVVVAAGSYSRRLAREVGLDLPVRPVKGYSITFPEPPADAQLRTALVDDAHHVAIVPLGRALRVAGTAEFAGFDLTLRASRTAYLMQMLRAVLPQAGLAADQGRAWCGLRPMTPDGKPIVGATPVEGLFVNTGHGHLGWTLACGSAQLLADLASRRMPQVDPEPFAYSRFSRASASKSSRAS